MTINGPGDQARVARRGAKRPGTKPGLRERLAAGQFAVVTELVPWRGHAADAAGLASLAAAGDLVDDPRIAAISITDSAGGHAMASPALLAGDLVAAGQDVIVHVACRDRSRNALLTLAWELESRGVRNVLCVSGDHPTEGFGGLSRPVFDMDSVGLLTLYRDLVNAPAGGAGNGGAGDSGAGDGSAVGGNAADATGRPAPGFLLGAAVSPFKRLEAEVIPQYLKLGLKVRSGADFVIPQLGYDARKWDELLRWMRLHDLRVPVLANVYVLSRTIARLFHANRMPGCVVSDELLARVEHEAAGADRGRAFFRELAARQVAVARGLGFAGVYLAGHRDADDVRGVLAAADAYGPDDWRAFARDQRWSPPGTFFAYREDQASGLLTDTPAPAYARTLTPRARARGRRRASPWYRANRLVHARVFEPGSPGFRFYGRVYGAVERARLGRPLHVLEQAVKVPLYDCRDCGDCSLPDVAYLCPESQCPKGERNGPCGGSHDGMCEVEPKRCVWVRAYERLKPYGEELTMLERPPVIVDNALRRTSAWANTFLGRDHFAARTGPPNGARPANTTGPTSTSKERP